MEKLMKKVISRVPVDVTLRSITKDLKVYSDVMHVDSQRFLVSVSDPLNLTMQSKIENESRTELGLVLGQLALIRTRGFSPRIVYTDPQSSFCSMTQDFPGVEIDVGGAGDYVTKIDAKIRRIKDMYRSVKSGLAWELPGSLGPSYTDVFLNVHTYVCKYIRIFTCFV